MKRLKQLGEVTLGIFVMAVIFFGFFNAVTHGRLGVKSVDRVSFGRVVAFNHKKVERLSISDIPVEYISGDKEKIILSLPLRKVKVQIDDKLSESRLSLKLVSFAHLIGWNSWQIEPWVREATIWVPSVREVNSWEMWLSNNKRGRCPLEYK